MAATSILINVGAKTDSAVRGLSDVNKALEKQQGVASKTASGLKKMMPVALASGAALAAGAAVAINAASDQEQAYGGLESIFKKNAESMKVWASEQSKIGLSATEAATAAALMGAQLKSSGDSAAEAATKSQALVGLGADLAATFGGSTADAVGALSAALKGEFEQLERYGVSLKASDISAGLAAKGQDKLTGAAKKAAEAAFIQEALWKKTADAQGKAAEEANTTAGSMATLKADIANLTAELGTKLLPIVETVLGKLKEFAAWAAENQAILTPIAGVVGALAAAIIALNVAMSIWTAVTAAWSVVTAIATAVGAAFGAVIAVITSPITLIILAIIALIAVIVLLWKNWDTVTKALGAAWQWLKNTAVAVFNAVKKFLSAVWASIRAAVVSVWNGIKAWLAGVWAAIKTTAVNAFNALKSKLAEIWTNIKNGVKDKVGDLIEFVKSLPGKVLDAIGNLNTLLFNVGKDLIQGLINGIKAAAGSVGNAIKSVVPDWVPGPWSVAPAAAGVSAQALGRAAPTGRATSLGDLNIVVQLDQWGSARVTKRAIEADDRRQGRKPGAQLARAW